MWLFLATIVLCLTIVVLFRMYIDLRRNDNMHARSLHRDTQNFQRYTAVTSRPVQRPSMPDFQKAIEQSRQDQLVRLAIENHERNQAQQHVRTWREDEVPQPTLGDLRSAEMQMKIRRAYQADPRLTQQALMRHLQEDMHAMRLIEKRKQLGIDDS